MARCRAVPCFRRHIQYFNPVYIRTRTRARHAAYARTQPREFIRTAARCVTLRNFGYPVYLLVIATRKRKRNSRSSPPMTFLFLSIIIGRAQMCPRTRRETHDTRVSRSFSLRVAQRATLPIVSASSSAWYPLPVHPRKFFTCSIETQDYQNICMYIRTYVRGYKISSSR